MPKTEVPVTMGRVVRSFDALLAIMDSDMVIRKRRRRGAMMKRLSRTTATMHSVDTGSAAC
jgi:hypothetical protein